MAFFTGLEFLIGSDNGHVFRRRVLALTYGWDDIEVPPLTFLQDPPSVHVTLCVRDPGLMNENSLPVIPGDVSVP